MESVSNGVLLGLGLLVRLLLPVGLTLGLAWLLGRLDRHWRAEAEANGQAPVARPLQVLRCWVLNDCPEEQRRRCAAYQQQGVPCWQLFRDHHGRLRASCLDCEVFRLSPAAEALRS